MRRRRATSSPCIGVNEANTGDTLCDQDHPIILERPSFPEPVISMSIEPKSGRRQAEARRGAHEAPSPGSDVPGEVRRGDRRDDHRRHGRIALGNPQDAPHPRLQGRGERRQAEGRVQGSDHQARPRRAASTSSSPGVAVSSATARSRSSRSTASTRRPASRTTPEYLKKMSWEDGIAWENKVFGGFNPEGVHPVGRVRRPHGLQDRRAGELPAAQPQDLAARWLLPPGRLVADRVRVGGRPRA